MAPAKVNANSIGLATDMLPAELRPFFPNNEELVRRLDAVAAALQGPAGPAAG